MGIFISCKSISLIQPPSPWPSALSLGDIFSCLYVRSPHCLISWNWNNSRTSFSCKQTYSISTLFYQPPPHSYLSHVMILPPCLSPMQHAGVAVAVELGISSPATRSTVAHWLPGSALHRGRTRTSPVVLHLRSLLASAMITGRCSPAPSASPVAAEHRSLASTDAPCCCSIQATSGFLPHRSSSASSTHVGLQSTMSRPDLNLADVLPAMSVADHRSPLCSRSVFTLTSICIKDLDCVLDLTSHRRSSSPALSTFQFVPLDPALLLCRARAFSSCTSGVYSSSVVSTYSSN
jgi:hypothetical protein